MLSEIFQRIESLALLTNTDDLDDTTTSDQLQGLPESLTSGVEGNERLRLVSVYERDPKLRSAAIRIHGTTCMACGFNFAEAYGQYGTGYIQVHHLEPLSDEPGERIVNPSTDLAVLCANCRVMIHRYRKKTLNVKRDPRVAVTVLAEERPFKHVQVTGRAEITDANLVDMSHRIWSTFRDPPEDFAKLLADQQRVLMVVTPESATSNLAARR